ncbi:transient receptor potential cation channel subfamily M member 2-like [Mya arenaria]|uniref:transient receptor potential cation channel subfamily M member 2-like n=1 Tax=Mya arenaria TaxID=6604 RepID=UPI0022E8A6A4|nr:transient receptor potential cation channel subfamily M member 2-like [Mya arenaria]XP_052803077.1 transient receptor potential cation channel subfamily M member 2-like [Mya arenaria]XP_052803078.1 transient receptor potential cation channel subfamily M member 2-like [Mya arenaria]
MATHSDNRGKSHVDTNGVEEDCQSSVYNQSIDTCGAISTSSNGADPDDFEKGPQDYFEEDNDDAVGAEKTPLRNRKSLKEHADEQATVHDETKWIREHIKRRECSQFIADPQKEQSPEDTKGHCYCGYPFSKHSEAAKGRHVEAGTTWDYRKHSVPKMTNAFGEIEFGGNVARYVRVDVDTNMSDMLEFMMKVWGLDKPQLLVSVTGGAKSFNMGKRLRDTFRHGLMKTTGAWVVTGGTNAGVMKHVGEAVRDSGIASMSKNQVIAIAIASWGCVKNKEALINKESNGLWPAYYCIEKKQRGEESFLDPNHSHFILVDNATQHKFGVEIPFRAKLEKEIAKIKPETGENAASVPHILLVLEGGSGTLETVHQAILNNTPTVVVKSSGRAADILAYAYLNRKEVGNEKDHAGKEHTTYFDESVEITVKEMIEQELGNTDTMKHLKIIKECLDKSDLMSVYEMEGKGWVKDIDVAVLQALFRANKYKVMDQLKLALVWNRIDVAKSEIFTDDKRWPTGILDDVMFSAILLNRIDFIKLFLEHGVSLKKFLTKERLLMLYNKIPPNCLLRTLLDRSKKDERKPGFSLRDVGTLIRDLMGDTFHPKALEVDYDLGDMDSKKGNSKHEEEKSLVSDQSFPHLFIWSILMIHQDIAKLFWAGSKDAIATALVGNYLLKSMLRKTKCTEVVNKIQEYMNEWSDLASGVLSECHSTDEHKAKDLLVRELSNWGDTSCMLIAVKAENKDFISQTACQSLLDRIWNGRLVQDNSLWRLLLCLFFPPLILVLPLFTKADTCSTFASMSTCTTGDNKNKDCNQDSHKKMRQKTYIPMDPMRGQLQVYDDKTDEKLNVKMTANDKLGYFFKAPIIIFMYNVCSYLVFLSLYTYILIFNFDPKVSVEEIILIIWVFAIATEEVRQMATSSSTTLAMKLKIYITDTWNVVDTLTIVLFIIGIILRFTPYESTFEAARVILAINFVTFFMRLLHIVSVHKELGPKLVMIGKMIQDLMYFLVILMVFMCSYAIASHSILYPNSPLTWNTAVQIIHNSYWNIYGELFLDEIEADCSHNAALWMNGTQARCPTDTGKWVVPIMMGIYMLLANVLLLNLLIAMFSNTFQKVQDNADKHWHFQRYSLIREYYTRHVLFPPFSLLMHIVLLFRFICESFCCKAMKKKSGKAENDFCRKFKNERELIQWEDVIAEAYHHGQELKNLQSPEHRADSTHNIIEKIQEQLEGKSPPRLESRLTSIEKQLESTQDSLEWIKSALQKSINDNKPKESAPEVLLTKQIRVEDM